MAGNRAMERARNPSERAKSTGRASLGGYEQRWGGKKRSGPGLRSRVVANREPVCVKSTSNRNLAPARNPLYFGFDNALDQSGQIVVEPGFQHRPQHFLDQVFQRPRVVAEDGIGKAVEGGFDRGYRRTRQDLLLRRGAFKGRRFVRRSPRLRFRGTGFGEFEVFLRLDRLERSRRIGQRHLVRQLEYLRFGLGRPDLALGGRLIETRQQSVDVILTIGRGSRRCRLGRWLRRCTGRLDGSRLRRGNGRWRNTVHRRRLAGGRGGVGILRLRGGCRRSGLVSRRFCFVVGNDATDRRQNLLHRGFLDLCRLRHLGLHIIIALAAFYIKQDEIDRVRKGRPGFSSLKPDLSPDQVPHDPREPLPVLGATERRISQDTRCGANRHAALSEGTSGQQSIASNGRRAIRRSGLSADSVEALAKPSRAFQSSAAQTVLR